MKKRFNKVKVWVKKNQTVLTYVGIGVVGVTTLIITGKIIDGAFKAQEQKLLEIVENNLKLVKEGEIVDVVTNVTDDGFRRSIETRRWTKLNGQTLYLGKSTKYSDLSDDEMVYKQLEKIGDGIRSTVYKIITR